MTKELSQELLQERKRQIEALKNTEDIALDALGSVGYSITFDKHWMDIARTNIKIGFMAARRAVCDGKRAGD